MRERDVLDATSLSRTTLWRLMKTGHFPRSVRISPGRVGWRESAIISWQENPTEWSPTKAV
ncbi:helix-turn-helix transcriptional regulator [Pseudomonas sp. GM60]|uniref:helix-turn-helix transcriptional regulator n=1 Tax=Pseudomonas sp. GM60 TaxID=1144334 RepID=UPI0009DAE85A|nr:AlpA family phage regulatory protein [Pseudomonas sp. GM60]